MSSEPVRDPQSDQLLTPQNAAFIIIDYQPVQVNSIASMDRQLLLNNIVGCSRAAVTYGLPIVHSTVNVQTGLNKPPVAHIRKVLGDYPTYDRTSINSWEDIEFRKAVEETGRKKLVMTALWTEACLTFPALDALAEGYEVYVPVDAVGGTSVAAHEAALRRIEQAGGRAKVSDPHGRSPRRASRLRPWRSRRPIRCVEVKEDCRASPRAGASHRDRLWPKTSGEAKRQERGSRPERRGCASCPYSEADRLYA